MSAHSPHFPYSIAYKRPFDPVETQAMECTYRFRIEYSTDGTKAKGAKIWKFQGTGIEGLLYHLVLVAIGRVLNTGFGPP